MVEQGVIPGDARAEISTPDLERLARKYRQLGELRRARARGEPIPERSVFRELAAEFPGALHELDNLPLEEIDRRAEALARAIAGSPAEPWMAWMARYHALMRAALFVKIRVAKRPPLSEEAASALAARAGAHAGVVVGAAFVRAVVAPPEGRLNRLVDAELAAAFAAPAEAIRRALFPRRRPA